MSRFQKHRACPSTPSRLETRKRLSLSRLKRYASNIQRIYNILFHTLDLREEPATKPRQNRSYVAISFTLKIKIQGSARKSCSEYHPWFLGIFERFPNLDYDLESKETIESPLGDVFPYLREIEGSVGAIYVISMEARDEPTEKLWDVVLHTSTRDPS